MLVFLFRPGCCFRGVTPDREAGFGLVGTGCVVLSLFHSPARWNRCLSCLSLGGVNVGSSARTTPWRDSPGRGGGAREPEVIMRPYLQHSSVHVPREIAKQLCR